MERGTKQAHEHIRAIVRLTNTLINESINKSDPILPPQRTLSKEDFVNQYKEHYLALKSIMSTIGAEEQHEVDPNIDEQITQERAELKSLVEQLSNKLEQLDHLRFWMDNMVFNKNAPAPNEN